jgi:hypothetical protein
MRWIAHHAIMGSTAVDIARYMFLMRRNTGASVQFFCSSTLVTHAAFCASEQEDEGSDRVSSVMVSATI